MTEFDTDLYEAVMEDQPPYANEPADDDLWILAAASAGRNAALIAAERKATPAPSDEALIVIYSEAANREFEAGGYELGDLLRDDVSDQIKLAGIRAVRDALGAWPQVPDGWVLESVTASGEIGSSGPQKYRASIWQIGNEYGVRSAFGPTPQAALAEAVRQAREVES